MMQGQPLESCLLYFSVLEGGLASATVLVSFGVLIGKINPLQLLLMGLIETVLFVVNCHIGYSVLGAVDVGDSDHSIIIFVVQSWLL